jgi:type VI secretion system protein ImpG
VRLNCTPVVNLFAHDGQPLTVDHAKTEYRVRPSGTNALHYSIHGIERVTGWIQGRGERVVYEPFESFRHAIAAGGDQTYYRTRLKPSVTRRGGDLYMSFVNREEQIARAATETVSLALVCSNGPLAELVPIGGIDQPTSSTPSMVTFQNIGTVTPEVPPPIGSGLMWRLIANMARNYASLADVDALRTVLSTYHFAATYDVQQARRLELLMEGLQGIETEPFEWIHRGLPIRGHKVRLNIVESKVGGEAEAHLFGAVLNQFLGIYASVNACHQLVVRGAESKVEFEWPARVGVNPGI